MTPPTTIIDGLRQYLLTYQGLDSDAPVWVDFLGENPIEYSIVPLPGDKILEMYIDGSSVREFPFAFQSVESTADDLARLESVGFFEAFAEWLESQTNSEILPTLPSGKTATAIQATSWGYLFEQGQSDTGIYQITAKITYDQIA
jgi:hypothetical protein